MSYFFKFLWLTKGLNIVLRFKARRYEVRDVDQLMLCLHTMNLSSHIIFDYALHQWFIFRIKDSLLCLFKPRYCGSFVSSWFSCFHEVGLKLLREVVVTQDKLATWGCSDNSSGLTFHIVCKRRYVLRKLSKDIQSL